MTTETTTTTRTFRVDTSGGDHDRFAHYVTPPEAVTMAIVTGTPVMAICGKLWVPSRKPDGYPVCPTCQTIYDQAPDE